MAAQVLERDIDIRFPHFWVLKASAGSGKTYALTQRYAQFILSDKIPKNRLKNILAITFSNNAAKEMRGRILKWLKSIYLNKADEAKDIFHVVSLDKERLREKAGELIEEILNNYSDFQVKTIDSFMTTIFKASAIDFGYNPDFDILMDKDSVMEYSFNVFLKNVREGTDGAMLFEEIISSIEEYKRKDSAYLWDPSDTIFKEISKIYSKLSSYGEELPIKDLSKEIALIKEKIKKSVELIEDKINKSGLEKRSNSSFLDLARKGMFNDIMKKGLVKPPVKKPGKSNSQLQEAFEDIEQLWEKFSGLIGEYASLYSRSFYSSYLKVHKIFTETIESIKRQQDKVFIDDINKYLVKYINNDIVPDVYFRLGETIYHFLIDEFQDTSPIQWRNLFPLIENSLSQNGSLLVVGDTKQAIYGFREADYKIMKELEDNNPFPSASHKLKSLNTNYRSLSRILDFNEKVFKEIVKNKHETAGQESGITDYQQNVKKGNEDKGYVEIILCEKDDENPVEKEKLQGLVKELYDRGYRYSDIAILTYKNEDVVKVSSWLNEEEIPFLSYSSLDIRKRKITGEIVSLLSFLDSPADNLSFATFILGDVFNKILENSSSRVDRHTLREFLFVNKDKGFLYKSFQENFPDIWDKYFARLFKSVGYLPLYDLVTEIFNTFQVFDVASDEEATLIKILEVIKEFEGEGYNNIRDFIEAVKDDRGSESEWDISIPKKDAVTVMTIHKAKGLGFPVTIVLLYEDKSRGFDYIVKKDEKAISLLKINEKISTHNDELKSLYEEEKIREMVNKLNSLYVGFTRAEDELYIIGIRAEKKGEKKNDKYPFNLLPAEEFLPSEKPAIKTTVSPEIATLPINHQYKPIEFKDTSDRRLKMEEKQRGEFIHRVLAHIEYVGDNFDDRLSESIRKIEDETGLRYPEMEKLVYSTVTHSDISEYFKQKPERTVRMEQEFSDRDGNLHRMDRLIIDRDIVTVIDYKTGDKEEEEKHIAQLKTYMKILREVFPDKKVDGIIAYVDLREVKGIN
ncbi:MAG: UvrD-helicase domain-containing protein [Nitrospirota bacterium]